MIVAFYDTRNYDRKYFLEADDSSKIDFRFFEMRLGPHVVSSVTEAEAVCVFVNDTLDRKCLEGIAERGVKIVALRCAGFNNEDLKAAARNWSQGGTRSGLFAACGGGACCRSYAHSQPAHSPLVQPGAGA